jgi:hypothetical protein
MEHDLVLGGLQIGELWPRPSAPVLGAGGSGADGDLLFSGFAA